MRASAASAALTPGTASLTQSLRFFDRSTSAETSALPAAIAEISLLRLKVAHAAASPARLTSCCRASASCTSALTTGLRR